MKAARPKMGPKERARTDLRSSLGTILHDYIRRLKSNPRAKVKDIVLLILTDGIWAGMENRNNVAELIKKFSYELKGLHFDLKLRPFGVEFIQFGNDNAATQTLRYLDDYLHEEDIPWVHFFLQHYIPSTRSDEKDQLINIVVISSIRSTHPVTLTKCC